MYPTPPAGADPHDRWFPGGSRSGPPSPGPGAPPPGAVLTRIPGSPDVSRRVNRAGSAWDFRVGASVAVALFVLWALVPLVWLEVILPAGVPHPVYVREGIFVLLCPVQHRGGPNKTMFVPVELIPPFIQQELLPGYPAVTDTGR